MPDKMKRVVISEPHSIALIQDEIPSLGSGDVLVKVETIGICGSDLHVMEGLHPFVSYPVAPGHEVSGIIIDVGEDVAPEFMGKKVALEPSIISGDMPKFEPGRYNISTGLSVMGFQVSGAMSEYFAAPLDRLHILPDFFSPEMGAMLEPLAVGVHAAQMVGNLAGRDVGVIGAGTIGLLTAQVAQAYGASTVVIADLDEKRRELFAAKLGINSIDALPEQSFDVVFECVGIEATARSAIQSVRKGGTISILGVYGKDVSIPMGLVQDRELKILGSLMYTGDDFTESIRLISQELVLVLPLITHQFALDQVAEAFRVAAQRGDVLKVMLKSE